MKPKINISFRVEQRDSPELVLVGRMKWITDSLRTLRKETNPNQAMELGQQGATSNFRQILYSGNNHTWERSPGKQDSSFTELAREKGEKTETEM